jgi:uncharacterized repeat protein (TIGR01451 family)
VRRICRLLALNGRRWTADQCPFSVVKQTSTKAWNEEATVRSWNSVLTLVVRGRLALASLVVAAVVPAASSALAGAPDLIVQLLTSTGIPTPVFTGETTTYIVDVRNIGDAAATHVSVLTTLPLSWSFVPSSSTPDCFFAPADVNHLVGGRGERALCSAGQVPAGASKRFNLVAKAPSILLPPPFRREIQSRTFITSSVVDPDEIIEESNENNNAATIETEVQTAADLVAEWTSGAINAETGMTLHYQARVRNKGDRAAESVTAVIDLPGSIIFDHFDGGDLHCVAPVVDPASGNYRATCVVSGIAAGGEATTKFTFHLSSVYSSFLNLTITADPRSTVPDRDRSNNAAALLVTIQVPTDIQIAGTLTTVDHGIGPLPLLPLPVDAYVGMTVVTLKLHVRNAGPAVSPPTIVRVDWAQQFSDQDSVCPIGTIFDRAVGCEVATRDPPVCFRTAPVPLLIPDQVIEIDCVAIINNDPFRFLGEWGTAVLDPNNAVLDPDRYNNHMILPNHAGPTTRP